MPDLLRLRVSVQSLRNLRSSLPLTQELLAFESVDISERSGDEFDKSARFQNPTTVNEIEQRERTEFQRKLDKVLRGR